MAHDAVRPARDQLTERRPNAERRPEAYEAREAPDGCGRYDREAGRLRGGFTRAPSEPENLRIRVRVRRDDGEAGPDRMVLDRGPASGEREAQHDQVLRKIDPVDEGEARCQANEDRELQRRNAEEQDITERHAANPQESHASRRDACRVTVISSNSDDFGVSAAKCG